MLGTAAGTMATTVAAYAFLYSSMFLISAGIVAALNSSSVDDFGNQGSWDTVVWTTGFGLYGSFVGYFTGKSNIPQQSNNKGACFVAGTLVETEGGSIPIETVTAGMLVYAYDPETGETELKEVVQTFVRETNELVHIKVNGEEIITTPTHPFWVPEKG